MGLMGLWVGVAWLGGGYDLGLGLGRGVLVHVSGRSYKWKVGECKKSVSCSLALIVPES